MCPGGALIALRSPALIPRAGKFCQLTLLPPLYRPVVLAPQKFRYTGSGPSRDISRNRCVRVSAMVVLAPNRAATTAATRSSSCSSNATKFLSVLAKAYVRFSVRGLILVGGSTPKSRSRSANLSLDISTSRSNSACSISSRLRSISRNNKSLIRSLSPTNIGSVNIRIVISIKYISSGGVSGSNISPSFSQISMSPWQYST